MAIAILHKCQVRYPDFVLFCVYYQYTYIQVLTMFFRQATYDKLCNFARNFDELEVFTQPELTFQLNQQSFFFTV